MKILIMCGGRGKRLGKLTESVPKPLVRVNDRTILELKIEQYKQLGYNDFIFCVGYKGEMIREKVESLPYPINAVFSNAGEDAGILKRLHHARNDFGDYVMMTYGDTFTDIDLNDYLSVHKKSGTEVTIVVAPIQNPFGIVEFDDDYKVTYFKEKPVLNYYIGYAILRKSALDLAPQSVIDMPDGEGLVTFYKMLAEQRKLGVYYHPGLQITFNTENELKVAQEQFSRFYTTPEEKNESKQ